MRNVRRKVGGKWMRTHKILKYLTSLNISYINYYTRMKNLGDPWGKGWAEWPCWMDDIVTAIEEGKCG